VSKRRSTLSDRAETLLLERSERFWTMISRARRGKAIAIETLRKQVTGRPSGGRTARSRPRRRPNKRLGARGARD
jgi:hypothetical protein